jgi:hypothetical protein
LLGEAIQLELACEPSNIVAAAVEVQHLTLPPKLMPKGGLEAWLRSDSCCLLQLAGSSAVKVRRSLNSLALLMYLQLALYECNGRCQHQLWPLQPAGWRLVRQDMWGSHCLSRDMWQWLTLKPWMMR